MDYALMYDKLRNGDHLSTPELYALRDHLETAGNMLRKLGPVFQLSATELLVRSEQISGYISSRDSREIHHAESAKLEN